MARSNCEDPRHPRCGDRLHPAGGFTLVKLVFALTGLLVASIVIPSWMAVRLNESRVARAERDAQAIADAIRRFKQDNGFLPAWTQTDEGGLRPPSARIEHLAGPGAVPQVLLGAAAGWLTTDADSLEGQLIDNTPGYERPVSAGGPGWRGPYLASPVPADPWGNRYLVSLSIDADHGPPGSGALGVGQVWILSAGPNGTVETPDPTRQEASGASGDDVLVTGSAS